MPRLTLIMPFYENASMLALHYREWALNWPVEARQAIRVVLVDDGSKNAPAAAVARPEGLPELQIFRIDEDKPWNQHCARNVGAHEAPDGWLLLTDMDHVLTAGNAVALLRRLDQLDTEAIYTLHRLEATTGETTVNPAGIAKPHPNSFVLTRDLYWRIGGYDEDFCGIYGTDGLFKARAFSIGRRDHLKKVALVRYWRDLIADSSTDAPRKEGRDPDAKRRIMEAKAERGERDVVKALQTPWRRVL